MRHKAFEVRHYNFTPQENCFWTLISGSICMDLKNRGIVGRGSTPQPLTVSRDLKLRHYKPGIPS